MIGREAALRLIGQAHRYRPASRNGAERVTVYVPRDLPPDHPLVRVLGIAAAQRLVAAFGGEVLLPANCAHLYREHRDRSLVRLHAQGLPVKLLASWFEVSERHVANVVRAERLHVERQPPAVETRAPVRSSRRA